MFWVMCLLCNRCQIDTCRCQRQTRLDNNDARYVGDIYVGISQDRILGVGFPMADVLEAGWDRFKGGGGGGSEWGMGWLH